MTEQENDARLSALLHGTVEDARGRLSGLSAPDLERLAELEESGKNRKGVIDCIGDVLVALADGAAQTDLDDTDPDDTDPEVTEQNTDQEQDEAGADDAAAAAAGADTDVDTDVSNSEAAPVAAATEPEQADAGKAARGEEIAEWQKPEYSGGLTGEQALWRKANLITK